MSTSIQRAARRHGGLFVSAAGVAAAFVVMIGTGYRVTATPSSPISDRLYFASIAVLVLIGAVSARALWRRAALKRPLLGRASTTDSQQHAPSEQQVPWPTPDFPTPQFTELSSRMLPLARLIDAPAHLIPTFQRSVGNGLAHIEIEGDTYHYVLAERGTEYERYLTTSIDDVLYRIFRDVAWSMSSRLSHPFRKPGEDVRREMFRQQLLLLSRLNPEWVSRCAAQHEEGLAKHPFVDEA